MFADVFPFPKSETRVLSNMHSLRIGACKHAASFRCVALPRKVVSPLISGVDALIGRLSVNQRAAIIDHKEGRVAPPTVEIEVSALVDLLDAQAAVQAARERQAERDRKRAPNPEQNSIPEADQGSDQPVAHHRGVLEERPEPSLPDGVGCIQQGSNMPPPNTNSTAAHGQRLNNEHSAGAGARKES